MNNNRENFSFEYMPTKKTAKDYYYFSYCCIKLMRKEARQFYIKEISKEELIKWNDEYINTKLDECYKKIKTEYSVESISDICYILKFSNKDFTDNKNTYKRIIDLIKLLNNKYGYFMYYKTSESTKGRCAKISGYPETLIDKPEINYDKNKLPNEQRLDKLTYYFPDALYDGIIPSLYYLGYMDLYEEFMEDIISKIFSNFLHINKFMIENGIVYQESNTLSINNYSLTKNLIKFFTKYELPIPKSLTKYIGSNNYKLKEIDEEKKSIYDKYSNHMLLLSTSRYLDEKEVEEMNNEWFGNIDIKRILEIKDYYLLKDIEVLNMKINTYSIHKNNNLLSYFLGEIKMILSYHSFNHDINKNIILLLDTFFNKVGYFICYDFKNVKYQAFYSNFLSVLIREKVSNDNFDAKYYGLKTAYHFKDKNYLGFIPRLYYLGYNDLINMLIEMIIFPICKNFKEKNSFIDGEQFTYSDISSVKDSTIIIRYLKFLKENNLEVPNKIKNFCL